MRGNSLQRARSYMREKLGVAPAGLWPSEGSVSDEALALAADCGFHWAASDNGVLARTLEQEAGVELTYQAYSWRKSGRELGMLFRDHYLSDLIGFQYSHMSAADAAGAFSVADSREQPRRREALVPIILDGENAWEWYEGERPPVPARTVPPHFGRPGTGSAHRFRGAGAIRAAAAGPYFPGLLDQREFRHLDRRGGRQPGMGTAARRAQVLRSARSDGAAEDARKLAFEELLIAEGSDWNWWYGPEHGSDNRPEFDQLYRDHLSNVYRALGAEPPANLSHPILTVAAGRVSRAAGESAQRRSGRRSDVVVRMDGSGALPAGSALRRDGRGRTPGARNLLRLR